MKTALCFPELPNVTNVIILWSHDFCCVILVITSAGASTSEDLSNASAVLLCMIVLIRGTILIWDTPSTTVFSASIMIRSPRNRSTAVTRWIS